MSYGKVHTTSALYKGSIISTRMCAIDRGLWSVSVNADGFSRQWHDHCTMRDATARRASLVRMAKQHLDGTADGEAQLELEAMAKQLRRLAATKRRQIDATTYTGLLDAASLLDLLADE